jgi:hypothetical protein
MEMNGKLVEARSRGSLVVAALILIGVVLIATGIMAEVAAPSMLGVYPLVLGVILRFRQAPPTQFVVEDLGLRFLDGAFVPYHSILALREGETLWSGDPPVRPLVIEHAGGRLVVPPRLSVPPRNLYQWLHGRVPPRPQRECLPELADYYAQQVDKFGAEKVELVHAREHNPAARMGAWGVLVVSILATVFVWGVIAFLDGAAFESEDERQSWMAAAVTIAITTSVISLLVSLAARSRKHAQHAAARSAIVIGPAGMALVQGPLKGALRWDEVRKVDLRPGNAHLLISVPGARFTMTNIYERSLVEITQIIRRNLE